MGGVQFTGSQSEVWDVFKTLLLARHGSVSPLILVLEK